jgi:hypothetical protein
VKKNRDQIASQELRDRLAREAAEEWASLKSSLLAQRAVEEWTRENPDSGTLQHGQWMPTANPRWLLSMACGSFVRRYVRDHAG